MWLLQTLHCQKVIKKAILSDYFYVLLYLDIILMTIVGLTVVLALVIVTVGYVCYKRSVSTDEYA
jgi:hypothetical protein